nr:hypothetical protein [Micromonospora sp. DSM 115978]
EVDTAVPFYSFSFHSFDFTRTHVRQPELLRYLENLVERYQLMSNIRLRTGVARVVWDENHHHYELSTTDGELHRFDVVVTAVGLLNNPRYPDWPGMEIFRGALFHSARWDHDVDLTGERVELSFAQAADFERGRAALGDALLASDPAKRTVLVPTDGSAAEVRTLLDGMDRIGAVVDRIGVERPTLDDVFLALTQPETARSASRSRVPTQEASR